MSLIHVASRRPLMYGAADFGVMSYDQFTGSNGTLLTAHTPDTGPDWSNVAGDFEIQSNHASAKTLPIGYALIKIDEPRLAQNIFTYWRNVNDFGHLRTCFRLKDDDNYWYVDKYTFGNVIKLYKKVSTSSYEMDTSAQTIANETWYSLWIDITGNLIEVYHAAYAAYPPAKPESPILSVIHGALATSRGVGLYATNAGMWWDNFLAVG